MTAAPEKMFVAGEWRDADSGRVIDAVNPATEELIGSVPAGGATDVDTAVAAASESVPEWAGEHWTARARALLELASRIRARIDELALLDVADAGLPITASRADVLSGAAELEYFAGLGGECKGFTVPADGEVFGYTRREPYGVVGRIIPFNHPFMFAAGKIAAPLMAGNAVIVKPSEHTSLSALALARLAEDLLPPGVLNIITGYGSEAGAAIASHRHIPRVAFTGSVPTGRAILRAGAEHIKHVTCELGGKNPIVICPDVDIEESAAATVRGMNLARTMGQSCQSNSRVLVHEDIADDFVDVLVKRIAALRLGDPLDENIDMGPLAFEAHYQRVLGHIETARTEGARLVLGGGRPEYLPRGYFVEATVFTDVTPDMSLAREEVFGPVMAVMAWSDEHEMLRTLNGLEVGLTAKIWTRDHGRAQRLVAAIESGLVWVNGAGQKLEGMPFGGYKQSGLGKEGCLEELVSYTREKGVIVREHP